MHKYYQPKGGKQGKFALRENTYRRIWYLIADYPYFKAVRRGHADALEFSRNSIDENVKVSEQMFEYDLEVESCELYIEAIEAALDTVPPAYADHIMSHIVERKRYRDMDGVSERTLKVWVQRFIWQVAHNLGDA